MKRGKKNWEEKLTRDVKDALILGEVERALELIQLYLAGHRVLVQLKSDRQWYTATFRSFESIVLDNGVSYRAEDLSKFRLLEAIL